MVSFGDSQGTVYRAICELHEEKNGEPVSTHEVQERTGLSSNRVNLAIRRMVKWGELDGEKKKIRTSGRGMYRMWQVFPVGVFDQNGISIQRVSTMKKRAEKHGLTKST